MKDRLKSLLLFALILFAGCSPAAPSASAVTPTVLAPSPTVTVVPTATEPPTVMRERYDVQMTKWMGYSFGEGAVVMTYAIIPNTHGSGYYFKQTALGRIEGIKGSVTDACLHTQVSRSDDSITFDIWPVSEACWKELETLTSRKPLDRIPQDVLSQLAQYAHNTAPSLYIGENGVAYGFSNTLIDVSTDCGKASLQYAGWDGVTPVIIINPFSETVGSILRDNNLINGFLWNFIPDFCGNNRLERVDKLPSWVKETHHNDMWKYEFDGVIVELHTDPTHCTKFHWAGGLYVSVVNNGILELGVSIDIGDVISLIDAQGNTVLVSYDGVRPVYMTSTSSWRYSSIVVYGCTNDCIPPIRGDGAYPYMLDGIVITQHVPALYYPIE